MALHNTREVMTSREREEFEQEQKAAEMQIDYNLRLKGLELELAKLESKWASWLRLPRLILSLPILIVMALAVVLSLFSKKELPDKFWEFLTK